MIIYNVTIKTDPSIADDWMQWLLKEHIPAVIATGCFNSYKVVQLLDVDNSEGPTFAIQYFADTIDDYKKYISGFAPALRQESTDRWGEKFIAFRSLMKVIA